LEESHDFSGEIVKVC